MTLDLAKVGTENPRDSKPTFNEHLVPREQGRVYARDYAGAGSAFVLMHGFPDNLHIYDDLIPYLVAAGRRVVAFDFLGFGASDKPAGVTCNFQQQLGDLEAVVKALNLGKIVPVAHDSSGPAALNFTLAHPNRIESLCILNSGYDNALAIQWPEMVTLFATKSLGALSSAIAQSPELLGWLLTWQKEQFRDALPKSRQAGFETGVGLECISKRPPAPILGSRNGKCLLSGSPNLGLGASVFRFEIHSYSLPTTSFGSQVPARRSCSWRRISSGNSPGTPSDCPNSRNSISRSR